MPSPAPAPAGTIMIVDDETDNLNVLDAVITRAGYRTVLFPRGELALAAAQETPPDLVLLDVRMPGLNGYDVCRRFKADDRLRPIPILFLSAFSAPEDIAAGFACGGVDYITKPFREPELLARVRTHLALREAYVSLAEQHARLRALERHRDTLVHMLVHDMRSPLQATLGHLQMIEERGAPNLTPGHQDDLRTAIHCTRLVGRMVSTAIDLSRMETESFALNRAVIPVRTLFQEALLQSHHPASDRAIVTQVADACPPLLCDADLSVRILANLFSNALKYAPAGSAVTFGAEPDPRGVRLWVRDQGPGIPARHHQHIFEKFGILEQAPGGNPIPASGLGLAFCKLAVESQGGAIGVISEPGKGSTFWFTLPAATATPAP